MSALLDQWADRMPEPHARRTLERHAKHHSWHAQLWDEIASETGAAVSGVTPEVEAFLAAVEQGDDPVDVLVGVIRVLLPRKVAAYTFHLRALGSGASDAAVRSIGFIMQDERDTLRDGELLLQSLITTPDAVERAAARRITLENLILRAGGLAGPGTLGGQLPQEVTSR
jgi:hypothetical protein